VDNYIDEIRDLAGCFSTEERNLPLYFPNFVSPPPAGSYNRIFGHPVGLTFDEWPRYAQLARRLDVAHPIADLRMEHVFTIDLRGLRLAAVPPAAEAMMLFISTADHHRADYNGNDEAVVVFVGAPQLGRAIDVPSLPMRSTKRWSRRFSLERVDVPGDVFDPSHETGSTLALLQDAIWQAPARLGGRPIFVRQVFDPRDQSHGSERSRTTMGLPGRNTFVMQFERRFVDIELGRDGVMYVSGAGAYYQDYG